MTEAWYPPFETYYVPSEEIADYPVRQGDIFPVPPGIDDDPPWLACQIVHPTCEFSKRGVKMIQVIGVHALNVVQTPFQEAIVAGEEEKDGQLQIAWANTFFLPPPPNTEVPLFSDFRRVRLASRELFTADSRIAALSHDTRVHFIRRKLYWEQRWPISVETTRDLEARRIRSDTAFEGPRPAWATPTT